MPVRTSIPDTDFDNFQPCFFESEIEDEFYDAPAPSEDIWKKFELLPTPPRSPRHEAYSSDDCGLFDDDDFLSQTVLFPELAGLAKQIEADRDCCGNLKSKLIQDCMWSGLNSLTATLGLGDGKSTSKNALSSKVSDKKSQSASGSTKNGSSSSQSLSVDGSANIDCVDPSTIFPYPVSSRDSLGVESPSDSDDEEEDEDEEEIDVVSVESSKLHMNVKHNGSSSSGPSHRSPSSMSAQVAAMHNYTQPHYSAPATPNPSSTHNHPHNHHSYHCTSLLGHKRSKAASSPTSPQPPSKKSKLSISADMRQVVRKLKISRHHGNHRYSSDSEDCSEGGKRAQHNVLERKRRNDLKYSFLKLRDHVPDLSGNDKAAKVVILRKATDYINGLGDKENLLLAQLEKEKQRNSLLQQKLAKLRNC